MSAHFVITEDQIPWEAFVSRLVRYALISAGQGREKRFYQAGHFRVDSDQMACFNGSNKDYLINRIDNRFVQKATVGYLLQYRKFDYKMIDGDPVRQDTYTLEQVVVGFWQQV